MSLRPIDQKEESPSPSDYLKSLYQLVPTEITAAYMAIYSALNPFYDPTFERDDYVLIGAVVILAVLNYLLIGVVRHEMPNDVKLFMSATFLIWVLGVNVDYWAASLPGDLPTSYFFVLIILWSVISFIFLKMRGLVDND